jgi:LDH2 family malate/lactate/ureidoglycolate dehydrogenase
MASPWLTARESNHFGAAAYWGQKISAAGMIGIVMCNASPIVAPWQAKEPRLGTNPICMSVPGPWLLDMATTTVANNRIFKALMNGEETIPAGWAVDSEGVPTTDTDAAIRGMPMPLGGYKGSGLAMMVEILCGVLSGGAMSVDVGGIRIQGKPTRVSQTFVAIDAGRFMPAEEFQPARRVAGEYGEIRRARQRLSRGDGGGRSGMARRGGTAAKRDSAGRWDMEVSGRNRRAAGRGAAPAEAKRSSLIN